MTGVIPTPPAMNTYPAAGWRSMLNAPRAVKIHALSGCISRTRRVKSPSALMVKARLRVFAALVENEKGCSSTAKGEFHAVSQAN